MAAGRGATFRYFGDSTGTSPLPITLAYFSGVPAAQAGDASKYTSTLFANTTYVNTLAFEPAGAGNVRQQPVDQQRGTARQRGRGGVAGRISSR